MDLSRKWIDHVGQRRSLDKLVLDLNSSVSQTYGRRERPSSLVVIAVWHGPRPRGHDMLPCVKHAHASVEHAAHPHARTNVKPLSTTAPLGFAERAPGSKPPCDPRYGNRGLRRAGSGRLDPFGRRPWLRRNSCVYNSLRVGFKSCGAVVLSRPPNGRVRARGPSRYGRPTMLGDNENANFHD